MSGDEREREGMQSFGLPRARPPPPADDDDDDGDGGGCVCDEGRKEG